MAERRGPGKPPLPPEERRKPVQFRLPPPLLERLDAACEVDGYSRTEYVERAVVERLDRNGR